MIPLAGVLVLGCGHLGHYNDYKLSSTLSIYNSLIAIVLRGYDVVPLMRLFIFWFLKTVDAWSLFFFVKMHVITSTWWTDRWFFMQCENAEGYMKTTSAFLLYGHGKEAIILFLMYPNLSSYNLILMDHLQFDKLKHEIYVLCI